MNACVRKTFSIEPTSHRITDVEVYLVELTQEKPYLGSLREGETVNQSGYFVRKRNQTVYPRHNRSLAVRICTDDGIEGWGETYGLVAPKATAEIIHDLLTGFLVGRETWQAETLHDELYGLMRVRGYTGGFYLDALAAIDIALWDITSKSRNVSLAQLLGGLTRKIPAYVSGLPEDTLEKRCELAQGWYQKGFDTLKFALPAADDGPVTELKTLREFLGEDAKIACDLHWAFSQDDAVELAKQLAAYDPWFLEAPVATEDVEALRYVAHNSNQNIAVGEEWRTIFDCRLRVDRDACHIIQPEMGHTGVTQFLRMGSYAADRGLTIIPHATIGAGIFLAASLQASAALRNIASHEYQHSVLDPFRHFTGDALIVSDGMYSVPPGPGIGVEPSSEMWSHMLRIA